MLHYSFDVCTLVSMRGHNHEDPLDSILIGNNEATEDNPSTNTPDLNPALIDTVTSNKHFQLFQNFMHSQGDTADNTGNSTACGEAASQIIIVMEQALFKAKVGTPHKVNMLKN